MPPITIFTPSFADEDNTNAQNLTVKELVSRLPADEFHVTMLHAGTPDPRISSRKNTQLIHWSNHGNTLRLLASIRFSPPDIYFFPRYGPLDRAFLELKRYARLRSSLITYIVMMLDAASVDPLVLRLISEADRVLANSPYVAETIGTCSRVQADVIFDGADQRFFYPQASFSSKQSGLKLTVLYAGSFQPRKRVELVIQNATRHPGVEFRLAGKGETENACRDLAERHDCQNVTFLGHLGSHTLGEEMRNADIFLFPSVQEGNPQVLLQAAACGLPAIATDQYHSPFIVSGSTGFLSNSDQELSDSLDLLLTNPGLRQSMSLAAARHAQNFDWTRIATQWGRVFQQVSCRSQQDEAYEPSPALR